LAKRVPKNDYNITYTFKCKSCNKKFQIVIKKSESDDISYKGYWDVKGAKLTCPLCGRDNVTRVIMWGGDEK
jgi:transposase-like protein